MLFRSPVTIGVAGGMRLVAASVPFSSVSLLLHMDGTNGSTLFVDSSQSPKSVTASGNAQISTTQSKFSGSSGLFDGSGDYLSIPFTSGGGFDFGTSNFTVEFFTRVSELKRCDFYVCAPSTGATSIYIYYDPSVDELGFGGQFGNVYYTARFTNSGAGAILLNNWCQY